MISFHDKKKNRKEFHAKPAKILCIKLFENKTMIK